MPKGRRDFSAVGSAPRAPGHYSKIVEKVPGALRDLPRHAQSAIRPTAADDPHFGPKWGERLYRDIPGAVRLELLENTGHLLMEEQPEKYAALIDAFLSEPIADLAKFRAGDAHVNR